MMVKHEYHPYLIHTNALHVFDVNTTFNLLLKNRINLENICQLKIYMCRSVYLYSFHSNSKDLTQVNTLWNKAYAYQVYILVHLYYLYILNRRSCKKFKRVTIIANSNDSEMNLVVMKLFV